MSQMMELFILEAIVLMSRQTYRQMNCRHSIDEQKSDSDARH